VPWKAAQQVSGGMVVINANNKNMLKSIKENYACHLTSHSERPCKQQ
jgi:hypothetical protein